jgi:hypothetical protein
MHHPLSFAKLREERLEVPCHRICLLVSQLLEKPVEIKGLSRLWLWLRRRRPV